MKILTTISVTILVTTLILFLSSCSSNKSDKFVNKLCDCFSKYKNADELSNASNNEQIQIKKDFTSVWNEIKAYENTLKQDEKDRFEAEMETKIKTCNCSAILSKIDPEEMLSGQSNSSTTDTSSFSQTDTTNTSSANSSTNDNNSQDWDKVLTDYSTFVDEYIVLLKKAKAGDASAVSDYPDILQKAQDLSEKLQSAQSSLSSSQAAKFLAIENKLAQAAVQLNK